MLAKRHITRAPGGKPYIAARARQALRAPVNFNVSHSGDVLLVALSRTAEIGVDVERVRAVPEWRAFAARMFTASARDLLLADVACGADEQDAFAKEWCRHEAAVKATGEGLFPRDTRDDANDSPDVRANVRVIDLPHLPLPAGAPQYRAALALTR